MPTMKMTLIGQYNYNPKLFDDFLLPAGVDKQTFINTLLLEYGEQGTVYPDPHFMKGALDIWSRSHLAAMTRISEALAAKYNPIENYDRYEDWSESGEGNGSTKGSSSGDTENRTSAYNAGGYSPEALTTATGSDQSETNSKTNSKHSGHIHGNIGVTTASAMIKETVELSEDMSVYSIIARMLATDLLLLVY